jgi:hypothetical protein
MSKKTIKTASVVLNANSEAMRNAGKGATQCYASAIAILKSVTATGVDEVYIATLRQDYLIGALTGVEGVTVDQAIDYLPIAGAKPGTKGKWSDFPVSDPGSFDAKVHRPLEVHNAYRSGLMGWSRVRSTAGLPSLKAPSAKTVEKVAKRKARQAIKSAAAVASVPVAIDTFVAPSGLDNAEAIKFARHEAEALKKVLASPKIKGDVGQVLRDMLRDMFEYLNDADKALNPVAETPEQTIKRLTAELAKRAA